MSKPHLLVLGADPLRASAFREWQAAGASVTLCEPRSATYAPLVDTYRPAEVRDGASDLAELVALARRHHGVTTLSDDCQVTAAMVAAEAGLPGPGVSAARTARSKLRQREITTDRRMNAATRVRCPDDMIAWFSAHQGPAVLKPDSATGSTAVFVVRDAEEAIARIPRLRVYARGSAMVLEPYVAGPEVSLELVVRGGEVAHAALTRKQVSSSLIETGHRSTVSEVGELATLADPWPSVARRLVAEWAMCDGLMHAEFRVPADGAPILIEAAVRPAGGLVCDIVDRVSLVHPYRALLSIALDETVPSRDAPAATCSGVEHLVATGRVTRTASPAAVMDGLPNVEFFLQSAAAGITIRTVPGGWARAGAVAGSGHDAPELDRQLTEAASRLRTAMGLRGDLETVDA